MAYSLGADGLAALDGEDADRAIRRLAIERAGEIAEIRLANAIARAFSGDE